MFQTRSEAVVNGSGPKQTDRAVKDKFHRLLLEMIDVQAILQMDEAVVRRELRTAIENLFLSHPELLRYHQKDRLTQELIDEMLGFGPLEPLLRDDSISDILINGPQNVFVERQGCLERTAVEFSDNDQLVRVVQRIANRAGRRVDESSPTVDARLPDGSRFNAVIPPVALDGALVSIRRFVTQSVEPHHLVANGVLTQEMLDFLEIAICSRLNMVISGGTGSGKTTLLNLLSSFIPDTERVVTIEDAAELRLRQSHVARMETRCANSEGKGQLSTRDLVRNALRMRPDRIIIGECRGEEVFDMLQAMNTGHEGSLTTIHSNCAADAISRLEMLMAMAQGNLPVWQIQRQIASSVDIIAHVKRLASGQRRVAEIGQVCYEQERIVVKPLFTFVSDPTAESPGGSFRKNRLPQELVSKMLLRGGEAAITRN